MTDVFICQGDSSLFESQLGSTMDHDSVNPFLLASEKSEPLSSSAPTGNSGGQEEMKLSASQISASSRTRNPPSFEERILKYLESSISNFNSSWLDEFRIMVDKAFSLDAVIAEFLSSISCELRGLYQGDSVPHMWENTIPEQIRSQFAHLPPIPEARKEVELWYTSEIINEVRTSHIESCKEALRDLQRAQNGRKTADEGAENRMRLAKLRQMQLNLEKFESVQDKIEEFIHKSLRSLKDAEARHRMNEIELEQRPQPELPWRSLFRAIKSYPKQKVSDSLQSFRTDLGRMKTDLENVNAFLEIRMGSMARMPRRRVLMMRDVDNQ
jgi:hypothetical protein